MSENTNKSGQLTYLGKYEELFIAASDDIEGSHDLPLVGNDLSGQLQSLINAIKFRSGDNNMNKKSLLTYFCEVIKHMNEMENEYETQTRKPRTGLVNISSLRENRAMQSDTRLS